MLKWQRGAELSAWSASPCRGLRFSEAEMKLLGFCSSPRAGQPRHPGDGLCRVSAA